MFTSLHRHEYLGNFSLTIANCVNLVAYHLGPLPITQNKKNVFKTNSTFKMKADRTKNIPS